LLAVFVVIAVVALLVPLAAHANAPAPPGYFSIQVNNAPTNAKYVELFLQDPDTSNYVLFGTSPLLPDTADFSMESYNQPIDQYTSNIKISLLDSGKVVIQTSDPASVVPPSAAMFASSAAYDAQSGALTVYFANYAMYDHSSGTPVISISSALLLAIFARMLISTTFETLIAVPFKIRPLWKIICVNIVTQLLLLLFVYLSGLNYVSAVILGEIAVFVVEYIAYILLYKQVSKARLAVYTLVANGASLGLGLLFNVLRWLMG